MNLILFLLLALTASRTGLVQCKEGETEEEESNPGGSGDGQYQADPDSGQTPYSNVNDTNIELSAETDPEEDPENLIWVLMIIIPLLLTLVIITVVVCVVIMYRRGRKVAGTKEDPYLDHEDHEKVPMPMFDDDVPSVMELEMEDLENWISKDGGKKMDTGQI